METEKKGIIVSLICCCCCFVFFLGERENKADDNFHYRIFTTALLPCPWELCPQVSWFFSSFLYLNSFFKFLLQRSAFPGISKETEK